MTDVFFGSDQTGKREYLFGQPWEAAVFRRSTGSQARRQPWGREETTNEYTSRTTPGRGVAVHVCPQYADGRIGDRSNAAGHRLHPSGVPRLLLWLLAATILFAAANYTFKLLG